MKKLFMLLASIALLISVFSCTSTPAPAPAPAEKPKEAPVVVKQEPVKEVTPPPVVVKAEEPPPPPLKVKAPADLKAQALELRIRTFILDLSKVLPTECDTAEKTFAKGNASYEKDNAASKASFVEAVKLYTDILARGLPLRASVQKSEAETWKGNAIKSKADQSFPELFGIADGTFGCADAFVNFEEFEDAYDAYKKSSLQYGILVQRVEAKSKRDLIILKNYSLYEKGNFSIAEEKYALSSEKFSTDQKLSLDAVDEAIQRYGKVIDVGREYLVMDKLYFALQEKSKADTIMANIAVKDEYAEAEKLLAESKAKEAEGSFEKASDLYDLAKAKFIEVYNLAYEKRNTAQLAIDTLSQKKESSLAKILDAELILHQLEGQKE